MSGLNFYYQQPSFHHSGGGGLNPINMNMLPSPPVHSPSNTWFSNMPPYLQPPLSSPLGSQSLGDMGPPFGPPSPLSHPPHHLGGGGGMPPHHRSPTGQPKGGLMNMGGMLGGTELEGMGMPPRSMPPQQQGLGGGNLGSGIGGMNLPPFGPPGNGSLGAPHQASPSLPPQPAPGAPQQQGNPQQAVLLISNLPPMADPPMLHDLCSPYGRVLNVSLEGGDKKGGSGSNSTSTSNSPTPQGGASFRARVTLESVGAAEMAAQALGGAMLYEGAAPLHIQIGLAGRM